MILMSWFVQRKKIFIWVIFWLLMLGFCFWFFDNWSVGPDAGLVLNMSWQIWHGKKMYVDFVEYIAPGSAYLIYFVWQLFGFPAYYTAQIISIILVYLSSIIFFLTTRKLTKNNKISALGVLAWFLAVKTYPIINHNVHSSLLAMVVLYFSWQAVSYKKWFWFLAAGFFTGLTLLFLQTKGLAVGGVLFWFFLIFNYSPLQIRIRNSLIYIAGFVVPLLGLLLAWRPSEIIYNFFILPNKLNYWGHSYFSFNILILEITILLAIGLMAKFWKRAELWLFWAMQLALYLGSASLIDWSHFIINSFPWLMILFLALSEATKNNIKDKKINFFTVGFLLLFFASFILFYAFNMPESRTYYTIYDDMLARPRDKIFIFSSPEIQAAKHIYAGPFMPGLYFELRKPNPFPVSNMILCDDECHGKTLVIFKSVRPEFVFINNEPLTYFKGRTNNVVDDYIRENYFYCQNYGPVEVFSLNTCPVF